MLDACILFEASDVGDLLERCKDAGDEQFWFIRSRPCYLCIPSTGERLYPSVADYGRTGLMRNTDLPMVEPLEVYDRVFKEILLNRDELTGYKFCIAFSGRDYQLRLCKYVRDKVLSLVGDIGL